MKTLAKETTLRLIDDKILFLKQKNMLLGSNSFSFTLDLLPTGFGVG